MYCQLTDLKSRLGITSTGDDAAMTKVIQAVSEAFDGYCDRKFTRSESASMFWDADAREIPLDRYPVESVTGIDLRLHARSPWVRQTVDYEIRNGCVLALASELGDPGQIVRVRWIGGYVLPGTTPGYGETALPADIEQAALDQSASWWENRHTLRTATVDPGARVSRQTVHAALLSHVAITLDRHKRMAL